MNKLNKNLEATKKKIPSMDIKELIKTWSDGYNPECLSLALQKIVENEDKYPKIAELFYKLQSELSNLAGVKMNFSERISEIFNFGIQYVVDYKTNSGEDKQELLIPGGTNKNCDSIKSKSQLLNDIDKYIDTSDIDKSTIKVKVLR